MHLNASTKSRDVTVEKVVKLARSGVKTIIRVDKRDILHCGAVASCLEQRPRIRAHIAGILLGIPYRKVAHAGACGHLNEAVGYACVCRVQGVAGLGVVPPALHRAVIVGSVLADAHFKYGAIHLAAMLFRVGPVAAQLHPGRQAQHIFITVRLQFLVIAAAHAHLLAAGLRAPELVVAHRDVHYTAACTVSGVDGRLKGRTVVEAGLRLRTVIGDYIIRNNPVFCRIDSLDTMSNHTGRGASPTAMRQHQSRRDHHQSLAMDDNF